MTKERGAVPDTKGRVRLAAPVMRVFVPVIAVFVVGVVISSGRRGSGLGVRVTIQCAGQVNSLGCGMAAADSEAGFELLVARRGCAPTCWLGAIVVSGRAYVWIASHLLAASIW